MATLSFDDLKESAQIYVQEWTSLSVKDEMLIPADSMGMTWISQWDNWLIPPAVGGIDPLIIYDAVALTNIDDYQIIQAGDSVRGKISLTTPVGTNAVVMASYRRCLYRDQFWTRAINAAANEISRRLLQGPVDITQLDDESDPWAIYVKQAGMNAMINLQTMLAGFGRNTMEGMTVDLARAASMIKEAVDKMGDEIDRDVVAWRWQQSPQPRRVCPVRSFPGPVGWGGW